MMINSIYGVSSSGGLFVSAQVPLEALPPTWTGRLLMVDHMAGFVSGIVLYSHILCTPMYCCCV